MTQVRIFFIALLACAPALSFAAPCPVDLYRSGNASSPRLDNVRPQDLGTFQKNGRLWVEHESGGVSTFARNRWDKNTWRLAKGMEVGAKLLVVQDKENPDHYFIEPAQDMPMDDYTAALRDLAARFVKIN